MMAGPARAADAIDLTRFVRPGDRIAWPQGSAEPQVLTRKLIEQRHELGEVSVFVATLLGDTLTPQNCDGLELVGVGGLRNTSPLTRAGLMDILPIRISQVPRLIESAELRIDVALVQLAGPDADGRYSLSCSSDYVRSLISVARVVIAEVNSQAPFTLGDTLVEASDIDVLVPVDYPPIQLPLASAVPADVRAVARNVAALIPDGATLQTGIGTIVDALPAFLRHKNDLGIHSGVISDGTLELVAAGVVTGTAKEQDEGLIVTGALFGTTALYDWADHNPTLSMRPISYTHDPGVLSQFASFWAVNSTLEVDLGGQANSELVGGRHVGAVGGQLDFINAGVSSRHGRSIIALTSTAAGGSISRISAGFDDGVVSVSRADADLVVTEYGVADLRGATLRERARRLIAIAHPDHRDVLTATSGGERK